MNDEDNGNAFTAIIVCACIGLVVWIGFVAFIVNGRV